MLVEFRLGKISKDVEELDIKEAGILPIRYSKRNLELLVDSYNTKSPIEYISIQTGHGCEYRIFISKQQAMTMLEMETSETFKYNVEWKILRQTIMYKDEKYEFENFRTQEGLLYLRNEKDAEDCKEKFYSYDCITEHNNVYIRDNKFYHSPVKFPEHELL